MELGGTLVCMSEVRRQFDYYLSHQDELVERFNGRFVVIVGERVVGDFESEVEAYTFATENYESGNFMVQLVNPGEGAYSAVFHSRVAL